MTHPYARELGDFLRARRDRLHPADVGLEPGGRRKVTGLRREELALLAGLSTDYYQRMEQGRDVRPSDDVLDALATALALDDELTAGRTCADWERQALDYIGMLRAAVAADPTHPRATAIVGELSIRSAEFRRLWARHDVRASVSGTKTFSNPAVGDLTLEWSTYPLPGRPGPFLLVFTPEPNSPDEDRLHLLASLHATRTARP